MEFLGTGEHLGEYIWRACVVFCIPLEHGIGLSRERAARGGLVGWGGGGSNIIPHFSLLGYAKRTSRGLGWRRWLSRCTYQGIYFVDVCFWTHVVIECQTHVWCNLVVWEVMLLRRTFCRPKPLASKQQNTWISNNTAPPNQNPNAKSHACHASLAQSKPKQQQHPLNKTQPKTCILYLLPLPIILLPQSQSQ